MMRAPADVEMIFGSRRGLDRQRTAASISAVLASTVFASVTRADTASFRCVAAVLASKTPVTELASNVLTRSSHGEIHTEDFAFTAKAVLRGGRNAEITSTAPTARAVTPAGTTHHAKLIPSIRSITAPIHGVPCSHCSATAVSRSATTPMPNSTSARNAPAGAAAGTADG